MFKRILNWRNRKTEPEGITPVLTPTHISVLPGTDVPWVRELHGPGGSDVLNHYNRKRQSSNGRYYSYQINPDTRLLYPEYSRNVLYDDTKE